MHKWKSRFLLTLALLGAAPVFAQYSGSTIPPDQMDRLVMRIALYPDPLLAQVLEASTFSDEIPDAAQWSDHHTNLSGAGLAQAMSMESLPWDKSVQALLPFPGVLDMMSADPGWTAQLGAAMLYQREDVMEAIQRLRRSSQENGFLQSNPQSQVETSENGDIEIRPATPGVIYVPSYDPELVFSPSGSPSRAGALSFAAGVAIADAFETWGWREHREPDFDWRRHEFHHDHDFHHDQDHERHGEGHHDHDRHDGHDHAKTGTTSGTQAKGGERH